jgi:hypothetical protein
MVHIDPDFKTKKSFLEALKTGKEIYVYQPGMFPIANNGTGTFVVEAPANYHKWYVSVECVNSRIIKVKR